VWDDAVSSPFFDFEDSHAVKTELWRIGNTALNLLYLFYGVNQTVACITFVDDFQAQLGGFVIRSNALRTEMMATDRFKAAEAGKAAKESKGQ
jgi:hypothetical protein